MFPHPLSFQVFPTEDPLRESVAKIVENTAFFFELTVSLPDHMDRLTYKNTETKSLMTWCFEFTQKMDIYDKVGSFKLEVCLWGVELKTCFKNPLEWCHKFFSKDSTAI